MSPTEANYAYLAGLIDGEGTVSIYLNHRGYYITQVSITQTSEFLIDWLQEMFGGNKHQCGNRNPAKHQERWKWQITSTAMREHLPATLPHLLLKKRHVEIVLEFLEGRKRGGNTRVGNDWQTALYDEIRLLNLRGADKIALGVRSDV